MSDGGGGGGGDGSGGADDGSGSGVAAANEQAILLSECYKRLQTKEIEIQTLNEQLKSMANVRSFFYLNR